RPPTAVSYGIAGTINGVVRPPPPAGLSSGEGRPAGVGKQGWRSGNPEGRGAAPLTDSARRAIVPQIPQGSSNPATSESASRCTHRPGSDRADGRHPRSRGTPTGPLPLP